ncbi:MAG: DUF2321 domain-containing protein [Candidatus Dormibacteraeota bacterium]|nr:DUF2321 domain-containing protein [Candidatus Dormibacteraeota bacterium]
MCLNGHSINRSTIAFPDFNAEYCKSCGAGTIMACPACEKPIPGDYHSPGGFSMHEPPPPPFCKYCGKPYPWTEAKLEAAREWASDLEKLNDRERELLAKSLDDLVVDVPMTRVSADRVKRLLVKAGGGAIEMFRTLTVDVLSEAAKKALFP